jgi:stalled ribosome rescue protein Dom34
MKHYHAVIWLDHREAKIFFIGRDAVEIQGFSTALPHQQLHNKSGSITGKRATGSADYYHAIVKALAPSKEWLITGPGSAKLELVKHVHAHDPQYADHIIGIETSDHPTDGQIVAHARSYFEAADRMLPQA